MGSLFKWDWFWCYCVLLFWIHDPWRGNFGLSLSFVFLVFWFLALAFAVSLASFFWCSLSTVMAGFLVTGGFLNWIFFSLILVCLELFMWDLSWSVLLGFVHLLFLWGLFRTRLVFEVDILMKLLICRSKKKSPASNILTKLIAVSNYFCVNSMFHWSEAKETN